MERVFERRTLTATLILNLEDSYARDRLGPRAHPLPYEPLQFWLVARLAPDPPEQFAVPRELVITRNLSGYHLFFGEELLPASSRERRADTSRPTRRLELVPGTYRLKITSPLYQTAEQDVVLPMPNLNIRDPGNPDPALRDPMAQYSIALRPSHAYPFPDRYPLRLDDPDDCPDPPPGRPGPTLLYGSFYGRNGRGFADVMVQAFDLQGSNLTDIYRTDESGQWVLWFPAPPLNGIDPLASSPVSVRFTLSGSAPSVVDVANVCVVRGCSTSLAQASLRGIVLRRGVGVAGATIAVVGQQATTSRADGTWTYCFDLNQLEATVDVTATLPDGTSRTQNAIQIRRRATVTVPTFAFL